MRVIVAILVGMAVAIGAGATWAQEKADPNVKQILGNTSNWRFQYQITPPVVRKDGKIEALKVEAPKAYYGGGGAETGQWLGFSTPALASGWQAADFNDVDWHRKPMVDPDSPFVGYEAVRGKFNVDDPAKVKGLTLTATYHGGVAVFVNGKEIARANLKANAAPEEYADDYAAETFKESVRTLADVKIPSAALRKGVNVLAFEVHRSVMPTTWKNWESTCGVISVNLSAGAADAVTPNLYRPAGVQFWNSSIMAQDMLCDYGDPNETLKPIKIIAPRAGAGSGKIVVGSNAPLKGIKASATAFTEKGGEGQIPISAVLVRYGLPSTNGAPEPNGPRTFMWLSRVDTLEETPGADVAVNVPNLATSWQERELAKGAVESVWVTVTVPVGTKPGEYTGSLTVNVPEQKPVTVPVELTVCAWKTISPGDYTTLVEVVESPESVAMAYKTPMWSEEHFKQLAKSLTLLGQVGDKTVYIPLICDTNMGNDESMVRWIKQADGSYKQDYSVMDKYLDAVVKYTGKPVVICLYVWDCYLEGGLEGSAMGDITGGDAFGKAVVEDRQAHKNQGTVVTMLDPATGKTEKGFLPLYSKAESRELWRPVMKHIMEDLKKRGLEKTVELGVITDIRPTKEVVAHWVDVAPGVDWVYHGHERYQSEMVGTKQGYTSVVAGWGQSQFLIDPTVERTYAWRIPELKVHNPRVIYNYFMPSTWWFLGEMNITGRQRGFARIGGDFFPVLRNAKGEVVGSLSARFPRSSWRMLNIVASTLAMGKEGPIATERHEQMREGLQECEARIYIEKALVDPAKRAKLGEPLAKGAQEMLDTRMRNMFRAVTTLRNGCAGGGSWWNTPGILGCQWFEGAGWQDQTKKLYSTAEEVRTKLGEPEAR